MRKLNVKTDRKHQYVDITADVEDIVSNSEVKSGICVVFCPHTTAALTINENADPAVMRDLTRYIDEVIPDKHYFTHAEGNSSGHIGSSLFGPSLTLIVDNGRVALGTWQGIYFCEFDGPRLRSVFVTTIEG